MSENNGSLNGNGSYGFSNNKNKTDERNEEVLDNNGEEKNANDNKKNKMDNFAIKENSLESKIDTIREDLKTMKNSIDTLGSEIIGIKSIEEKILEQLISMNNKFS